MTADGARSVRPAPDVVAQRVGGEVVLVNLRTNAIYALNPTGARVWELVQEGRAPDDVVERLVNEFAVQESDARVELDDLLASLEAAGLVVTDEHV